MNYSDNEIHVTTPERKRAYIQRWLLDNPHDTVILDPDKNEETPPSSPEQKEQCTTSFAFPLSPVLAPRPSTSCTITKSPILGGKRLASSPIIGGRRRSIKKLKVAKKLDATYTKDNTSFDSKSQTVLLSKTDKTDIEDNSNKDIFIENATIDTTVIIKESDTTAIVKESDSNFTFDDSKSTNQNISKTKKIFRIVKRPLDDTASQLIESVSSTQDTSNEKDEQNIVEASSDTDKTISDFIEDISTQAVFVTPKKCNIPLSQKISNPSSPSSTSETDVHISEITAAEINTNFVSLQTDTPTDPIDTVSTLDSRIDLGKTSYILQHTSDKSKRKKNYQKGGLLDTLLTTMAKEKSNVNLLRHQVCKKTTSIGSDKPFILLQIVEYMSAINDFQLLKCILIEDSMDLLSGLLNENRFISVINVPEISCIVNTNTNDKPVLKVYEPWTIIDPNQLILHITRFIAIPSNSKNCSLINDSLFKKDLKTVREFDCPCIEENRLSSKCKMKFRDCSYNVVKTVFNYVNK